MNTLVNRRTFLKAATATAGAGSVAAALPVSTRAAPVGANGAIRVAIIGLGTMGQGHVQRLANRKDVRVVALCDLDRRAIARALQDAGTKLAAPFACTDAREIMPRPDVDAIVIASGNHWHALQTVWGCQAGKDVYVEKPMTHTVWEGRKIIAAAEKYGRIVQVGTQYRSETGLAAGIDYVRSGALGKLQHVHAVSYLARKASARRDPWYPDFLDYDLFCGPTPVIPLERAELHWDWHLSWATGNGTLGNFGAHQLDIARRYVGAESAPRRVLGLGGRYGRDDFADTPNTQIAVYDYEDTPVIFESRALPEKPGSTVLDQVKGLRVGVVAHCEGGYVAGAVGCAAYDPAGKLIRKFVGDGGRGHMGNFLDAVRSRRTADLAAPAIAGHVTAAMCHYGNISLRVGEAADPAAIARALEPIPAAADIGRSVQRHLEIHGIDLARHRLTLGSWLEIDPATDDITRVSSRDETAHARARYLLHEVQRPPFVIPDKV
ncbi:MAG: Gfo/Idh/MocA family oxidoreductase [Verrucomicrobia bacterium]|nr:Gfo/Idh/MocA family oxidoreductase [Verrucomicrobiota bacterium]